VFFAFTCRFSILLSDDARLLWLRALGARKLFMQCRYTFKTWSPFVCDSPLSEQNIDLLPYLSVHHIISCENAQTFKKRLVSECFLKSRTRILDKCIQYDECTDLAMYVAIFSTSRSAGMYQRNQSVYLQLLSKRSCCFCGTGRLDPNNFDEVYDSTDILDSSINDLEIFMGCHFLHSPHIARSSTDQLEQ
jgi:hypothetical protein